MKEVLNFLKEAGAFYIATVDGDQPTVRPFAFFMEFEEKLYFATNKTSNVYQQLQTNPKFQVSVIEKNLKWVRITGKAHFDSRPEVLDAAAKAIGFQTGQFALHFVPIQPEGGAEAEASCEFVIQ